MSMKPMKSKGQQGQLSIYHKQKTLYVKCGNYSFIQSFFLKRISALMSPIQGILFQYKCIVVVIVERFTVRWQRL